MEPENTLLIRVRYKGKERPPGTRRARIGVNAPRETAVHRKEVYTQIQEENKAIKSIPPQNA